MKKSIIYIFAVAFTVALMASCRTREHCPAYGQADDVKTEKSI